MSADLLCCDSALDHADNITLIPVRKIRAIALQSNKSNKSIKWPHRRNALGAGSLLGSRAHSATNIELLGWLNPGWMLALFAALGVVAGTMFGWRAIYGGCMSCVLGLSILTGMGFVGPGGGDGNLFYVYAMLGSSLFILSSVVASSFGGNSDDCRSRDLSNAHNSLAARFLAACWPR